jgi:bifunctional UDP-N-acetylglucosamine pyrophosphorylase/glucosamine-1-phosphate N-acetyltransferase
MKSSLPKVLHPVAGRPLLQHVVDTALQLQPSAIHVVVGHGADEVRVALGDYQLNWVEQKEQLGTGHAVMQALPQLSEESTVLVLYGDVPLIRQTTLQELVSRAATSTALLTARLEDPAGYGRILRNDEGALVAVVEHKDATAEQLAIDEINSGVLAAPVGELREYLPAVGNENSQGEYYLPDILSLAVSAGKTIESCLASSELEILGVNDRLQLNQVEREFQRRQGAQLLLDGVSVADINRLDIRGQFNAGRRSELCSEKCDRRSRRQHPRHEPPGGCQRGRRVQRGAICAIAPRY